MQSINQSCFRRVQRGIIWHFAQSSLLGVFFNVTVKLIRNQFIFPWQFLISYLFFSLEKWRQNPRKFWATNLTLVSLMPLSKLVQVCFLYPKLHFCPWIIRNFLENAFWGARTFYWKNFADIGYFIKRSFHVWHFKDRKFLRQRIFS